MSLTFPTAYSAITKLRTVEEDWLLHLFYDDESVSDRILLSGKNRIINTGDLPAGFTNYHYGIVEDFGEISRSVNLTESKASIGNVTIRCINRWKGGRFSDILYSGTYEFLNRKVWIYSCLNNTNNLDDCLKIYEGKLIAVNYNAEIVNLEIEQWSPWKGIKIPQHKSSKGKYFPVAYGNFIGANVGTDYHNNKKLFPIPVNEKEYPYIKALSLYDQSTSGTGATSPCPHFYDSTIDRFLPLSESEGDTGDDATVSYAGGQGLRAYYKLERKLKFKPISHTETGTANENLAYDNPLIDETDGGDTEFVFTHTDTGVSGTFTWIEDNFEFQMPQIEGKVTEFKIRLAYKVDGTLTDNDTNTTELQFEIINKTFGASDTQFTNSLGAGSDTYDSGYTTDLTADIVSNYESNGEGLDDVDLTFRIRAVAGSADYDYTVNYRIVDIRVEVTVELDFQENNDRSNLQSSLEALAKVDFLYSGGDGYDEDFTGGSGSTASLPHEIHRDLLDRFSGFDYADAAMEGYQSGNQYLSDDLDSARSGWICRWWVNQPVLLQDIIEQLQFEGCFIFFPVTGGGKYIWVHNSYTSGDITHTLDEKDYEGLYISITDIKELVTKTIYNYNRHPATNEYIDSETYTNSTARTAWNIGTEENIEEFNLDFLNGSTNGTDDIYDSANGDNTPNESIVLYYDNIKANPKILCECEIVNFQMYDLELGDIVQFNDSLVDPYGKTWSDLYFMIVEIRRGLGKLYIKAREVYES